MRISDWSSDECASDLRRRGDSCCRARHRWYEPPQCSAAPNFRRHCRFPWSAPCKHGMQRPGMILDIEPITYVAAVAIDRQWFASQGTDRKRVEKGKSVSDRVDLGGRRKFKKKN